MPTPSSYKRCRARKTPFEKTFLAGPRLFEDFVIAKLTWAKRERRTKDFDDARAVLAVPQGELDLPDIHHWCDQHGTRELLEKTLRPIPPLPDAPPTPES